MESKYLTEIQKQKAINDLIGIIQEEFDESIGIIKANNLLDSILKTIGKEIYNKSIDDSKSKLSQYQAELEFQLEELKN